MATTPPPPDADWTGDRPESGEDDPAPDVTVSVERARVGPALVVVGLVLLVTIGGFAVAIAGSGHKGSGGAPLGKLPGVAISARAAAPVIRDISVDGDPPSDVSAALVVPARATIIKAVRPAPAVNLYSGTAELGAPYPTGSLATFFERELRHDHWSIVGTDATPDGRGTRIFARIASADGYYWEVGVTIEPATQSITPALAGGATPTSTVSLTVFEVDDAD